MSQITFFSPDDAILMESCVENTLNSWKRWIEQGELPEGWTIESALDIIEQLVALKQKMTNISDAFNPLLTEDIRAEVEEAAREQGLGYDDPVETPIPQNVLNFPTPEA